MISRVLSSRLSQTLLLLVLLGVCVAGSFSGMRWRQQIRNLTFDTYNILAPRMSSDMVKIIDIDEASIAQIGQMPWPRSVMADMVAQLKHAGADIIVFDIVFAEADRQSPAALKSVIKDSDVLAALEHMPDNDALFGQAIADAGNVVTGFSFTNEPTGKTPAQKGIFRGKNLERFVPRLQGASVNLREIETNAAGNGSFFVSTDTDGIIRRVPMLVAHGKPEDKIVSIYPSLALETARVLDGQRGGLVQLADAQYARLDPSRFGIEGIFTGRDGRFIPTNARGEFMVYFSKSNQDWYMPAHKILDGALPAGSLKGKIVLVGTSAVGLKDIRSTPLDTFVPGVEVHLNIIDQILQGQYLHRSIEAEGAEALFALAAGAMIVIAAPFVGALSIMVLTAFLVCGAVLLGWYGFAHYGFLIDVAYPVITVAAMFILSTLLTYLRSERDRRQVRDAFGHYISPEFLKELEDNPDKLKLGGEMRDLSVMFTDIRKFTSISEGFTPEELIQLMNDFLTPMSNLVMGNRGTIDKYMGDAMMAFWNAPLDDPHHAANACRAALGMQAALAPINASLREKRGDGAPVLQAGIGINTGACAVGNMGSRQRFAYSALGDAVNLASRLEGQTKTYGVDILVGEQTFIAVPEFAMLELDLLRVVGRTEPVRVYALVGDDDFAARAEFTAWKNAHDNMMRVYRAQDFAEAMKRAQTLITAKEAAPLREFYAMFVSRNRAMLKTPPPKDWDGVYDAQGK